MPPLNIVSEATKIALTSHKMDEGSLSLVLARWQLCSIYRIPCMLDRHLRLEARSKPWWSGAAMRGCIQSGCVWVGGKSK